MSVFPQTWTQPQPVSLEKAPDRAASLDLNAEIMALRNGSEWKNGVARKELLRYPDFQITLRLMRAQARIAEHYNPGRVSVHTLFGHIRMRADGKVFDLPQGRVLVMDRCVMHDVEALMESAFLLTVSDPVSVMHH